MSGLVGRGSRSFKKKIVEQSLIPALGIKKVRFAHRAAAEILPDGNGEITISFSTFIAPPEMVAEGFSNPSSTEITNLRTGQFRNNVRIESNLNGVLIDQIAYTITDTSFTLMDEYIVTAGEIFVITVGSNPVTGNRIVDARPLRASGDVDFSMIGSEVVNFEVGQGFRVAGSTINSAGVDNQQIGNVQVFVDGVLQFRNNGNGDEDTMAAAMQTGNYREIALDPTGTIITGVDYANAIRFNMGQPFSSTEGVLVVATNLIVDEPNGTGLTSIVDNNTANILANTGNIAANTAAINSITETLIQVNEVLSTSAINIPSGAVACKVTASGGGGGGGGGGKKGDVNNTPVQYGDGGKAGWYEKRTFSIGSSGDITGNSINVVIGARGLGQTKPFANSSTNKVTPSAGGDTTLSSNSVLIHTWNGGGGFNLDTNPQGSASALVDGGIGGSANVPNLAPTLFAGLGGSNSNSLGGIGALGNSTNNGIGVGINHAGGGGGGGAGYQTGIAAIDVEQANISNTDAGQGGDGGAGGMLIEWYSSLVSN